MPVPRKSAASLCPAMCFASRRLTATPCRRRATVPILWVGTAERISAIVEMTHPGVWLMGDLADDDREHGMGIVVEYADRNGQARWIKPQSFHWDYTLFGKPNATAATSDDTIEMTIVKHNA